MIANTDIKTRYLACMSVEINTILSFGDFIHLVIFAPFLFFFFFFFLALYIRVNWSTTAAYLHTRNTVLLKENRKEIFRRWLRRISLGTVEVGCPL